MRFPDPYTVLTLIGLLENILGAALLSVGVLSRDMAIVRTMNEKPYSWISWIPVRAATLFGSPDVNKTTPDWFGGFVANFWGIALLIVGFVLQLIGSWPR